MHTRLIRILYITAVLIVVPGLSSAHSPHHVVTDIAATTANGSESLVYILITDQVFRSADDGSSWKNLVTGLNNQYSFTSLVISPIFQSDKTIFVSSSGDGIYRSASSGDSWQRVNEGLGSLDIETMSISAQFKDDQRLLAAAESGGVWRSDDGGDNWHMVLTESVQIVDFSEASASPEEPLLFAGDTGGNIWRSIDNGLLWEIIYELPDGHSISDIGGTADDLFVGTESNGLYLSTDAGVSFTPVESFRPVREKDCRGNILEEPVPDSHITSVTVAPNSKGDRRVFVTTWYGGVFVSGNDGQSWSTWSDGLRCDAQADSMSQSHFRNIAISYPDNGGPDYWVGAFDGVFRSAGEGLPWQQKETLPLGLIKGMAVTGGVDESIVISIATYGGGFYLTTDHGANWTIGNKGLQTTRLTGLAYSPDFIEDGVIFAGALRRLLKSSDYGESWQLIDLQKRSFGQRVLYKLSSWGVPTGQAGSSGARSYLPVYPTHIVSVPGIRKEQVLFGTRAHGLMAFDGMSGSFEPVWSGTDKVMNSLLISPDFEHDKTLFTSIRGEGVFRSGDGGVSWQAVNTGLNFVPTWASNPGGGNFRRDVFLAISPDYGVDHTVFASSPAADGLYATSDSGDTWKKLHLEAGQSPVPVLTIALSPDFASDNTMIISTKGQGTYRSNDRGLSFESVGEQFNMTNTSIEWLAFSPWFGNDKSIVAASDEQLFVSEDRGETWNEVPRPVRYEDMRDVVRYVGDWDRQSGENYSAMTETVTTKAGNTAHLRFVGAGIRWLGSRGPQFGSAQIYVDDKLVGTVNCNSSELKNMQELFTYSGLEFGAHTIEIRPTAGLAGESPGIIGIDAFDVLPQVRSAP